MATILFFLLVFRTYCFQWAHYFCSIHQLFSVVKAQQWDFQFLALPLSFCASLDLRSFQTSSGFHYYIASFRFSNEQ